MAEVKWIKITTDIFDDEKIRLIESMPDADSVIVIWFKLLTFAGKLNDSGLLRMNQRMPYTDEMLSTIFRRPLNTVRMALKVFEDFGMIEMMENTIAISKWEKHQSTDRLEELKKQNRERQAKYRERQRQKLAGENVTLRITSRNALEQETETEQEEDKELNSSCSSNGGYTDIWESITPEQMDSLYENYLNAGDLVQEVYEEVKHKHKTIKNPYSYICGYARNKEWPINVNQLKAERS